MISKIIINKIKNKVVKSLNEFIVEAKAKQTIDNFELTKNIFMTEKDDYVIVVDCRSKSRDKIYLGQVDATRSLYGGDKQFETCVHFLYEIKPDNTLVKTSKRLEVYSSNAEQRQRDPNKPWAYFTVYKGSFWKNFSVLISNNLEETRKLMDSEKQKRLQREIEDAQAKLAELVQQQEESK